MNKFAVLNINQGSFEQGFTVSLGIGEDGVIHHSNRVTIPPAPKIPDLYQEWQNKYRKLGQAYSDINLPPAQSTHYSVIVEENNARINFENYLRQWFADIGWKELRVSIQETTQADQPIRVIIDTENLYLKKLPWHLWELFHYRPHAEFALSAEYAPPSEPLKRPIKILAIFGGSQGLDLYLDRALLEELRNRGAKVTWLEKPQKSKLNESLWNQKWDILFFAGHSSSAQDCNTGQIQINDSESISLSKLRNSLRSAVGRGLKLAIFNSCDGLGLAHELRNVGVPQMIVMREPVPDGVAREFFRYFLEDFSKGHPLYFAVRNARQRLEVMEEDFPCATWLPVICQNPAARPLVWANSSIKNVKKLVFGGIAIAFLFIGYQFIKGIEESVRNLKQITTATSIGTELPKGEKITLKDLGGRFSWGEKILIPTTSNPLKEEGVEAFKQKNYEESINYFYQSLQNKKNDPETLIYLNNAVAMQPSQSFKLPVASGATPKICVIDNSKPLKIAVIAPGILGTQTQINEDVLRGVAQAQNKINSNCGIRGRLLQVVIADDNDVSNTSVNVAKKLSEQKDILAVVGHYSSSATLKVGEIYEKNQMVAISPSSTAVRRSEVQQDGINLSKNVFRTPSNDGIAIKNLVNYMVNTLGHRKAGIAYDSRGVYSKKFREYLKKELESPQVKGKFVDIPECDFFNNFNTENCLEKANQTVKVLAMVPETATSFNKAMEIIDSNLDSNLTLLGGDSLHNETIEDRGERAKNLVFAIPWFSDQANPSEFEKNAQQLWNTQNTQMSWRSAMSYDATKAIIEGLRRMGNNPNRQGLQKELSATDFHAEGAAGKVEFENGDRRITPENNANLNVLVRVECKNPPSSSCKFVKVRQQ